MIERFLNTVEKAGNKLPQPVTLFFLLAVLTLLMSALGSSCGFSAEHPATGETIYMVNLLERDGIQRIFLDMVSVFAAFPPLGLVLVVMLGIGVAERSGLIETVLRFFIAALPGRLLAPAVVFAGMLSSLAVDAGYVVLIPLGAIVFLGGGRHPVAGIAAAFAGVSGGFSANLLLTSLDPLLSGFTEPAARIVDPEYSVHPAANWYIMAALVPFYTIAGALITEKIVEPRLGPYLESAQYEDRPVSRREKVALLVSIIVSVLLILGILASAIPETSPFRDEEGTLKPFLSSIVVFMFFLFIIPGLVYGIVARTIRSDKDVSEMMTESMSSMGNYIVLAFFAAQFVAFFSWSNAGILLAINGADFLQRTGFTGIPLMIAFLIVSSILNIFMGSASAKWAIMAPVFVPMFMLIGYSPEATQAAYRIGDSVTNIITPLLPYFPLIIVFVGRYMPDPGIGTLLSLMVPYSIAFMVVGLFVFFVWLLLGLPVGPGAPIFL